MSQTRPVPNPNFWDFGFRVRFWFLPAKIFAGFRISLHGHNVKPVMQFSSQLIYPGTESMINVKPTISYTTKNAISTFSPNERGCYVDEEIELNFLTKRFHGLGYRFEMNNCLIDEGIRDIIWKCRCIPMFIATYQVPNYFAFIPVCTGKKLYCANTRAKSLGNMEDIAKKDDIFDHEALESPELIGNISKPSSINCLPACTVQDNSNQMSIAPYPQKQNFFYQKKFCDVASHVWIATCNSHNFCPGCNNNRRILIDQEQPNLCSTLEDFDEYFGINSTCDRWPNNYLEKFDGPNTTLRDELYEYGKQNLALIHVMIQSPYVTKIKRDVAMTFTSYVANTGGLLGLCLGFSFISLVEILFWVCCCCLRQVKG